MNEIWKRVFLDYSQLVIKCLVISLSFHFGYDWTSWVLDDLGTTTSGHELTKPQILHK